MSRPPDCACGVWQRKQAACASKPAGMESETPRRSGVWHAAHDCLDAPPPRTCVEWSKRTPKVRMRGKLLSAGEGGLVWQTVQMGLEGSANCCEWQPEQGTWPGSRGRGELSSRLWQSRHGSRACCGVVWPNFEKSKAPCASPDAAARSCSKR